MTCDEAQDALRDALDEPCAPEGAVALHLEGCSRCAALYAAQHALDQQLAEAFRPPSLSPSFRAALRRRVDQERTPTWWPALPELVHLVACGVATCVSGFLLPLPPATTVMLGTLVTGLGYVALVVVEEVYAG